MQSCKAILISLRHGISVVSCWSLSHAVLPTGLGESELSGLCFRFPNDLTLVAHEKKAMSLAEYIHLCSTVHGVANFEIANHTLLQKQYAPALWCSN